MTAELPVSWKTPPCPFLPSTVMDIALFGTSADPPSLGHCAVIRWLASRFDRVAIWASDNPFKPDSTPLPQRTEMLKLAIAALQAGSSGTSPHPPCQNVECCTDLSHRYSIVSIQRAQARWPQARLTFAIGSDLVTQLPRWYRAKELLSACALVVIPRPGYALDPEAIAQLRRWGTVTIADVEGPMISSSAYRHSHDDATIPDAVADYIAQHQLYRERSPSIGSSAR